MSFFPQLPAARLKAGSRLPLGNACKVFVRFVRGRLPLDNSSYLLSRVILPGEAAIVYYCVREPEEDEDSDILECIVGARNSIEVERLVRRGASGSAELRRRVVAELQLLFPGVQDQDVEAVQAVTWGSDPLYGGAWVHGGLDASSEDFEILAAPMGRLHFAGEATCRLLFGSVSGALASGGRAAVAVLGELIALNETSWPLFDPAVHLLCDLLPDVSGNVFSAVVLGDVAGADVPAFCSGKGRCRLAGLAVCRDAFDSLNESVPAQFRTWQQQSGAARQAWQTLGWSRLAWQAEAALPPSTRIRWLALTPRWHSAAQSLGYTEQTWDFFLLEWATFAVCRRRPKHFQSWDAMVPRVRASWRALGLGRGSWEELGPLPGPRDWYELSANEREAALRLGFRHNVW